MLFLPLRFAGSSRLVKIAMAVVLLAAAAIWGLAAYASYRAPLQQFAKWVPR